MTAFLPEQVDDLLTHVSPDFFAKEPIPILWTKDAVILTLIDRVREFLESFAHDGSAWLFGTFQGDTS